MADYNAKIEELKKALLHTSNLRQLGNSTRKKYRAYGLDPSSRSVKYQPAKIIECTQNVVELRKLINDWCKLEKAKKASLNRMQHERWALETQYSRLLGEDVGSDLQESFKLEPGFRFKANGERKKSKKNEVTDVVEYIKNWNAIKRHMKIGKNSQDTNIECQGKTFTNAPTVDSILEVASENSMPYFASRSGKEISKNVEGRPTKDTDTILGTVNVTKAIEETEKALKEIYEGKEIKELGAKGQSTRPSSTFLRAASKESQYSGGPDAVKTHCEMNKAWEMKDSDSERQSSHRRRGYRPNCTACEFKLSTHKNDFIEKKLEQLKKPLKKWQSVSLNPSADTIYSNTQAVSSPVPNSKSSKKFSSRYVENKVVEQSVRKSTSPQKLAKKELKPTSVPNVLRVEIRERDREPIIHTKSTDYVDQKEWVTENDAQRNDENCLGDGKTYCTNLEDELTPRTKENLRGIAKLLLRQSPCSIPRSWEDPSRDIEGIRGKAISERDIKCTEPLYHQMIEKNSISDKDSLEVLQEMNPAVFINRHLDNIEFLSRGVKHEEDDNDSTDAFERNKVKDRKYVMETLRKNLRKSAPANNGTRPKSRKASAPSVKALKQMAEMDIKESEYKINNFLKTLPPPSVSIERWRAHDGVNKSVYEAYAPSPRNRVDYAAYERDLDYEKDPFVVNPELLLKELDECKLLKNDGFEPIHYGSSHV